MLSLQYKINSDVIDKNKKKSKHNVSFYIVTDVLLLRAFNSKTKSK